MLKRNHLFGISWPTIDMYHFWKLNGRILFGSNLRTNKKRFKKERDGKKTDKTEKEFEICSLTYWTVTHSCGLAGKRVCGLMTKGHLSV